MEIKGVKWNYDRYEVIADGIVHGVGVVFALVGVTALIFYATVFATSGQLAAAWVYGTGLVLALAISFAYNIWPVSMVKWHLRRFDHSAIYIMIAGTYTALLSQLDDRVWAWTLIGFVWVGAIGGSAVKLLFPGRWDRLSIGLYLLLGWVAIVAIKPVVASLPGPTLVLVLIGGLFYTVGVLFYRWDGLKFQNAIWHGFVAVAAACHWAGIAYVVGHTA